MRRLKLEFQVPDWEFGFLSRTGFRIQEWLAGLGSVVACHRSFMVDMEFHKLLESLVAVMELLTPVGLH